MKGTFIHSWVSLPIKSEGRAAKGPCVPREPQPDQHPVSGAPAFTMPLLLLLQGSRNLYCQQSWAPKFPTLIYPQAPPHLDPITSHLSPSRWPVTLLAITALLSLYVYPTSLSMGLISLTPCVKELPAPGES